MSNLIYMPGACDKHLEAAEKVGKIVLFLLGTWIFFDPGEGAFVIYAGVYLVIGMVSMVFSSWLGAGKRQ